MKRESYRKTTNAHYENRKADRPKQVWRKPSKKNPGVPTTKSAATKGEIGAIPVYVKK
jgi:hypothetical protein